MEITSDNFYHMLMTKQGDKEDYSRYLTHNVFDTITRKKLIYAMKIYSIYYPKDGIKRISLRYQNLNPLELTLEQQKIIIEDNRQHLIKYQLNRLGF